MINQVHSSWIEKTHITNGLMSSPCGRWSQFPISGLLVKRVFNQSEWLEVAFPTGSSAPSHCPGKPRETAINKTAASSPFILFTERLDLLKIESFWKAHNHC